MINELLKYEHRLNSVGIVINDEWHPRLKQNSKGGKDSLFLLVRFDSDGNACIEEKVKESHISLRYYDYNKNNSALTFKSNNSVKRIVVGIQNTTKLSNMLIGHTSMNSLHELAKRLERANPEIIWNQISSLPNFNPENDCYISLDVNDIRNSVQTEQFLKKLNKCLFQEDKKIQSNGTKLDSLGSPNPVSGSFNVKVEKHGNVEIYSCNENNKCYERYGMNGTDRCSFSIESRNRLSRIFQEMMKHSHVFKSGKKSLIAVSTLLPEEFKFEGDFTTEAWRQYTESLVQQIINQKRGDVLPGEIIVFNKPLKGPWSIGYKKPWSLDELKDCVSQWDAGAQYFSNVIKPYGIFHRIPSIFGLTNVLSTKYCKGGDIYRTNKVPIWSLNDSIELFSGSDALFRKAAKIASEIIVPVFVDCVKTNSSVKAPDEMKNAFAIFGMILNKEKVMPEDLENHPMYCLGRLLHEADRMHLRFFTSRSVNPPKELIGQVHMKMCYDNPQLAFASFCRKFQTYLSWAENRHEEQQRNNKELDRGFSLKTYREMCVKIGTEIPIRPSAVDSIALASGFAYRKPTETLKTESVDSK